MKRWIELWDRREPPTALALVRILVAVTLLADLLTAWRLDLVTTLWAPAPDGFAITPDTWSVRWFGAGPHLAHGLWTVAVISLVLIAIGLATRVACVAFVLVYAQMAQLAPDADRGIDVLLRVVIGILAFSYSHARWSVDAWIRRRLGRPYPELVPAWSRYLLFLQLVWTYFSGGHNKTGSEWGIAGGCLALGNILSDPHFARFDPEWVAYIHPLTRVATFATMTFELAAPLVLAFTYWHATRERPGRLRRLANLLRLRWVWIGLGMGFHLGIAATLQLGIFPWGMLAIYPVLLHPDELIRAEALLRRLSPFSRS